jgi:hypothetical protein
VTPSVQASLERVLNEIGTPAPGPGGTLRFQVLEIGCHTGHFAGRDSTGQPCLLINSYDATTRAPIRLAAVEVRFSVICLIVTANGAETKQKLTAIICTAHDKQIQSYFAHVAEIILKIIGPMPSIRSVADAVGRLVELFQRLARPATRSITGLFGELYVIHMSCSPKVAVLAWRSEVDDRFDFSIEDVRLEVKASSDRIRAHNFSIEQCMPPARTVGILVSLFVESSGGGLSIEELMKRIEGQLDGDANLILRLQETVIATLGETSPNAFGMCFDEHLARASLQIYELAHVPAIRDGIPAEVTQVRFRSNLSRVPTGNVAELVTLSKRVRDLLPTNP